MRFSLPARLLASGSELPTYKGHGQRKVVLPTIYVIFALLLQYVLAYSYFRRASARDPTSFFFDRHRAYEQVYSKYRTAQADKYIKDISLDSPTIKAADGPPQLCIGVATVARRGKQYVGTTVGSLLEGLQDSARRTVFVDVLLAHSDPHKHPNADDTWMTILPDRVLHYNQSSPDFEKIIAWEEGGWYRNKTIYDYTFLLRDCYNTGAEYVLMVEDDTIAARGWHESALNALDKVSTRMQSGTARKWAYLRLFYVEDLLGWNSEEWPRYLFWSLVIWITLTSGMLYVNRKCRGQVPLMSFGCVGVISMVFIPLGIGLGFMAGRQTVWPIAAGVQEMNKYGCCSQALVFPRTIIPLILSSSDLTTDWLVDMMIEKIADKEKLDRWALVPALFQHIGTTSSKGYGFDDNAKELWNFRFENTYSL